MIKIGICDDDKNIVNKIKEYIEDYNKEKFTISTYYSGEELVKSNENFNTIFLDVDMTGINGIETAKRIRVYDKEVKIIYVTSYADYINLAFQVHAFGYLNKPINKEQIYSQLDEIISYSDLKKDEELLSYTTTEGIIRIKPSEIYYFEYFNRKVNMKTIDKTYIIKDKITNIANKMESYGFYMPHKSFTVNLFYVKSIKSYDIYIMDGSVVPLSQKKSVAFREALNAFLESKIS